MRKIIKYLNGGKLSLIFTDKIDVLEFYNGILSICTLSGKCFDIPCSKSQYEKIFDFMLNENYLLDINELFHIENAKLKEKLLHEELVNE